MLTLEQCEGLEEPTFYAINNPSITQSGLILYMWLLHIYGSSVSTVYKLRFNQLFMAQNCTYKWTHAVERNFLVAYKIKTLLEMQETRVRSLSWENPLEKEKANHSSILAWRTSWREELGGLQSMSSQRVGHDRVTKHTCAVETHIQGQQLYLSIYL